MHCCRQAAFIRGGGGILDQTHPPDFGPTRTHLLIVLWGTFFVSQIEAKTLSQVRHPCPKR